MQHSLWLMTTLLSFECGVTWCKGTFWLRSASVRERLPVRLIWRQLLPNALPTQLNVSHGARSMWLRLSAFRIFFISLLVLAVCLQTRVTVRLLSTNEATQARHLFSATRYKSPASNVPAIEGSTTTIPFLVYSEYNSSIEEVDVVANDLFQGNFCERIALASVYHYEQSNDRSIRIHFHCRRLFEESGLGTGNFISAIYALRVAAKALRNVSIDFRCSDAQEEAKDLILPWLTGTFPAIVPSTELKQPEPSLEAACGPYGTVPIGAALDDIKWEMRRLAVALVGIPFPGHPAEAWAAEQMWSQPTMDLYQLPNPRPDSIPLISSAQVADGLDDAVLHFRCGDLIFSNLSRFGFMKFNSYARHLHPNTKTIGIATQSYQAGPNVRSTDIDMKKKPQRCRQVVEAFVEYLQDRFPNARVTVRNDPNETVALTFARMVMAQQVVVGISSFGVFPAVATFGRSYIRNPDYQQAPNRWLLDPLFRERASHVTLIEEERLTGKECRKLWGTDGSAVLAWLRS